MQVYGQPVSQTTGLSFDPGSGRTSERVGSRSFLDPMPHRGSSPLRRSRVLFAKRLLFRTGNLRDESVLLKCSNCGALVQNDRSYCGLCGSSALLSPELLPKVQTPGQTTVRSSARARAIGILIISVAVLVQGALLVFLPIAAGLTALGFFLMALGAIMLLVITGVFSGTPYRSRILNRYERDRKRRAQRRNPD
jgi:hypothetical protein